jgi:type IV pilus assembly protein PilO
MSIRDRFEELQSLDLQRPGSWPTWVYFASAILTAVLIVAGGTYFYLVDMRDELRQKREQETALFSEFERKQKKVVALDDYKAQLKEMERSFGAMLRQLPSKSEVANLLNDISQTRVASSLDEELFQPQGEVTRDFYAEIPNRIVVTGTYHEMGTFVSGVAGLPRIVVIDEVDIKPATASQRGSPVLRMSALAKTYRYLDENELATKPSGRPGG